MLMNIERLPIIHARPAQIPIIDLVAQRMNQMQPGPGHGAHAADISSIGRNLGLEKHHVQHGGHPPRRRKRIKHARDCLSSTTSPISDLPFPRPLNPAPSPKSIVFVDDEKSYNDLIRQMLAETLEADVHGFIHPMEALDAIVALDPGVVVTDYFMPEMNGIEFIQRAAPLVPRATFI